MMIETMKQGNTATSAPFDAEFAMLFEQLSRPDAAAPIDVGLSDLVTRINLPGFRQHFRRD